MEKSIAEVQRSVGVKKCFFQKIAFCRTFVMQINIHVYNLQS